MSVGAKLMTAEEFLKLPSEGQRLELIRGEVVSMASGGGEHGGLICNVTVPVGSHVMRNGEVLRVAAQLKQVNQCRDVSLTR